MEPTLLSHCNISLLVNNMSTADSTDDEALAEAYLLAAEKMAEGASVQEMRLLLMEKGYTHADATHIISAVAEARAEVANEAANRMMKNGAFWCVGGSIVTAFTYRAAANGGSYIVAWGAILFYGAIEFLQGLSQLKKPS